MQLLFRNVVQASATSHYIPDYSLKCLKQYLNSFNRLAVLDCQWVQFDCERLIYCGAI